MEKEIAQFRPIDVTTFNKKRIEKDVSSITFILNGGRVLKNIVLQDKAIIFMDKSNTSIRTKGESIYEAINRLNLREHEIEYIIKDITNEKSIESSGIKIKRTELIYTYHEKN